MAVVVSSLFDPTVLTTSAATLYTVPSTPTSLILARARIRFTNTSASTVSVTAYGIPSGDTAGDGNCFLNAESIAPNAHLDADVPVLGAGGFIQVLSDTASAVTAHQLDGILFS